MSSQTVVISGASSGIGAETARIFSENGYSVLLLGRNQERLNQVRAELKTKSETCAFDLKHLENHKESLLKALQSLPPVSALVNNAALYKKAAFVETTDQDWHEQFEVNFMSVVRLTRFFWPLFVKQKKGSIVNVSSTLGQTPILETSSYSALKAALDNLTMALAQEGGPYQIRVNTVSPGLVDTPIHPFHSLPQSEKKEIFKTLDHIQLIERVGRPRDIAEAIYFLSSEASSWTTGANFRVDGGVTLK